MIHTSQGWRLGGAEARLCGKASPGWVKMWASGETELGESSSLNWAILKLIGVQRNRGIVKCLRVWAKIDLNWPISDLQGPLRTWTKGKTFTDTGEWEQGNDAREERKTGLVITKLLSFRGWPLPVTTSDRVTPEDQITIPCLGELKL